MIAEVRLSCGRLYLSVAGIAVAMQGDKCRHSGFPEEILDPIPEHEKQTATIGGKPIADMPNDVIRFFRGDAWNEAMLEHSAKVINEQAPPPAVRDAAMRLSDWCNNADSILRCYEVMPADARTLCRWVLGEGK